MEGLSQRYSLCTCPARCHSHLQRRAADKGLHRLCKRVTPGGAPSAENLPPLSTLVHCAAVLPGHPQILPMGMDVTLVTNHLGPMALTMCLIPRLLENAVGRAKPSRVVTVSSFTHRAANLLTALQALEGAKDVFIRREYLPGVDYMNSKLLLTMAARHLHCSYPDLLQSHLADPGAVDSCLIRSWPGWLRLAYRFGLACLWQLNTPKMAASAVEAACLTDAHGGCSRYWFNLRGYAAISSPSHVAQDPGSCRVVWDRTCRAAADFLGSAGA